MSIGSGASASEYAFKRLLESIGDGSLAAGAKITEMQLSELVGVSRTPLRDAVRRLEDAGVLVRSAGRGLRVASMSLEEMLRLSRLREALEGLLVRYVAERQASSKISLSRLEQIVRDMQAVDPETGLPLLLRLGWDFHREISVLSGDPLAVRMLEQVMISFERYRHLIDSQQRPYEIVQEHVAILDAIRAGDGDAAEGLIRKHLQQARALYSAHFAAAKQRSTK